MKSAVPICGHTPPSVRRIRQHPKPPGQRQGEPLRQPYPCFGVPELARAGEIGGTEVGVRVVGDNRLQMRPYAVFLPRGHSQSAGPPDRRVAQHLDDGDVRLRRFRGSRGPLG